MINLTNLDPCRRRELVLHRYHQWYRIKEKYQQECSLLLIACIYQIESAMPFGSRFH